MKNTNGSHLSKILILGAMGSLGRHVVQQAISADHEVSIMVRRLSSVPAEVQKKVNVYEADIAEMSTSALANIFQAHDVVINTAGNVAQGRTFTNLIDHIVTGLESIPEKERPVSWFLAGAALLDMDESGRRGIDLPHVSSNYWPHRVNFDRICQTTLDWRILCPGPMVDQPPVGLTRMRVSLEKLPVQMSALSEMIVPYADAASLMIANIAPNNEMSRHRVGLALPVGAGIEKRVDVKQN